MNTLYDATQVTTLYDGAVLLLCIFGPAAILGIYSYRQNRSSLIRNLFVLSALIAALLSISLIALTNRLTGDVFHPYTQLGIVLTNLLGLLNLCLLSSKYTAEFHLKSPDADHVTRKYFALSLNSGVILILLMCAPLPFMSARLALFIATVLLASLLTLIANNLLVRTLLVDRERPKSSSSSEVPRKGKKRISSAKKRK